jgi:hypothetical protein
MSPAREGEAQDSLADLAVLAAAAAGLEALVEAEVRGAGLAATAGSEAAISAIIAGRASSMAWLRSN